jgi:radical SAM protein with 4Fe4S-binding SPASM domain
LELSTYEAYKTIDQVVALRPDEFILTGGDLLERADLFQLIDYSRRRGLKPTATVTVSSSLTGAVVGKIKHNGADRIAIALDGAVPERHDEARGINGQFGATLLALRWARTAEIGIEVNTLLSRRNMPDLPRIAELLTDIGVERWNIYVMVPVGHSKQSEMLTGEEVEQAFGILFDLSQRTSFPIRTFEAPHYRRFLLEQTARARQESLDHYFDSHDAQIVLREPNVVRAAAGDDVVFISHTGEVSASPLLPLTAGNVRYQPLGMVCRTAEMFAAIRDKSNLKGKCLRCEFRNICGGSRARAFAMTGDVFASDPLCAYQPGAFVPTAASIARVEA